MFLGHCFESAAHDIIAAGGKFNVRPLDHRNYSRTQQLKTKLKCTFTSLLDVTSTQLYYVPDKSNLESVDSISLPSSLYQMTISLSHPIKVNGL